MKSFWFWFRLMVQGSLRLVFLIAGVLALLPLAGWAGFQLNKQLFDGIAQFRDWSPLVSIACLIGAVKLLEAVLNYLSRLLDDHLSMRVVHRLEHYLYSRIQPATITSVETPEYMNDVNLARNHMHNVQHLINSMISLAQQVLQLGMYGYLIVEYSWLAFVVLVVFALPNFIFETLQAFKIETHLRNISQYQMSSRLMSDMLVRPQTLRETMIFGAKHFLFNHWKRAALEVIGKTMMLKTYEFKWRSGLGIFQPAGVLIIQMILIQKLVQSSITLGDYVAITTAVASVEASFLAMSYHMRLFKQIPMLTERFSKFISSYVQVPAGLQSLPQQGIKGMEIRGLSFIYPNMGQPVLRDIDLDVQHGDVIAIVGENGSGKSTLGKVIAGLHEVPPGTVFVDGVDINALDREEWFRLVSVVNQDFMRYPLSVYENIALEEPSDEVKTRVDRLIQRYPALVPTAIREDLTIRLGTEFFHSRQISGGQWQRIAIARALYKDSPVLLLDEATSELDPAVESDLIRQILQERQGRTTILVTHNLTLAALAARIIVMHHGRVEETGSHHTLLREKNRYYEMWNKQHSQEGVVEYGQNQLSGIV
ncbi:ABC transporter ATP-binding protein [Paenibacillus chitinolyticus]|uniref:ABC transporter ATP-binding protein n=1 Tax=Paenibacillus chitinolyticus TaxID=79263 RepID=UPI001C468385|nr:ABC transporter ATP-binding protein [Paenibacillus chitinolyticus]MBV6717322.1 ABC transporter ATP-binding protein/permease [Paenibacillus chitinolyticus]